MLQFFFLILLLIALAFGAQWLFAHPGEVVISWFGYDITLHIVVVVAVLVALAVFVGLVSITFWQLLTWGKRRRARKKYRTLESGLKQLTLGVTALAMGDETLAQEALQKASLALPNDPLPQPQVDPALASRRRQVPQVRPKSRMRGAGQGPLPPLAESPLPRPPPSASEVAAAPATAASSFLPLGSAQNHFAPISPCSRARTHTCARAQPTPPRNGQLNGQTNPPQTHKTKRPPPCGQTSALCGNSSPVTHEASWRNPTP